MNDLVKRGDLFFVPATKLRVEEDLNIPGRDDHEIPELAESLWQNGPRVPLRGYKDGEQYVVVVGHRRKAAADLVKKLHKHTVIFPFMVYPRGITRQEILLDHFLSNDGMALTPLQKAYGVAKLVAEKMKTKDIASKLGMSEVYVGNLLKLADAPMEAQELVKKNVISATVLIQELKKKTNIDEWIQKVASLNISSAPAAVQIEMPALSGGKKSGKKTKTETTKKKTAKVTKKNLSVNSIKELKAFIKKGGSEVVAKSKLATFAFVSDLLENKYDYDDILKYFEK